MFLFFDATTVFPDHVVGRITAIGALAALIQRERTGVGARIHVSQAEAGINQLDTMFVTRQLAEHPTGDYCVTPAVSEHGVHPSAGDDEWCVISTESDDERQRVIEVLGDREGWDAMTAERDNHGLADELQAAGVAAAPMCRRPDILDDQQLQSRGLYQSMSHPLLEQPLPAESGPAPFRHIGPVRQRPAPLPGQDTRGICARVLGYSPEQTARLFDDGVLFETVPAPGGAGLTPVNP